MILIFLFLIPYFLYARNKKARADPNYLRRVAARRIAVLHTNSVPDAESYLRGLMPEMEADDRFLREVVEGRIGALKNEVEK